MSGNGTTGGKISPTYDGILWPKPAFLDLIDSLRADYRIAGPMGEGLRTAFREIAAARDLNLTSRRTMIPPGKAFLYQPREQLFRFGRGERITAEEIEAAAEPTILVGVNACDIHAIHYLDRTLLSDPYYRARREQTLIFGLNCTMPSPFCFCSSVGTGPQMEKAEGYDCLLTDLGTRFLIEPLTEKTARIFGGGEPASAADWQEKAAQARAVTAEIGKSLDTRDLDQLLLANVNHRVWARTADDRCLSCTNCVMVCPTCFCYDVRDTIDMGLEQVTRHRQWDACQDMGFAAIHGGNFRRARSARLRQFVLHKLSYTAQYGVMGTVGCGRCIEWCPTGIDLTELAKEIQRSSGIFKSSS